MRGEGKGDALRGTDGALRAGGDTGWRSLRDLTGLAMAGEEMLLDGELLVEQVETLRSQGVKPEAWAREALIEELIHRAQILGEQAAGRSWVETYTELWNDPTLPKELRDAAAQSYEAFDTLSDAAKGAEVVRMVIQGRWRGTITERIFKAIQNIVDYLRGLDVRESPLLEQTIARTEAVLAQAQAQARTGAGNVEIVNEPQMGDTASEYSLFSTEWDLASGEEATPLGVWKNNWFSDLGVEFQWTKPPTAKDIAKAVKAEWARTNKRRLEISRLLEEGESKRRSFAQFKTEEELIAERTRLNQELMPRVRAIVQIPAGERGKVEIVSRESQAGIPQPKDAPPFPEALGERPYHGAKIVEAYTHKSILPVVSFDLLPEGEKRAFNRGDTIFISPNTRADVVAHEIIHSAERKFEHVLAGAVAFLKYRARYQSEGFKKPVLLRELTGSDSYKEDEFTFEDDWVKRGGSAYSGKFYPKFRATEILTLGIQRLHADPYWFAKTDEEYFRCVVRILRQLQAE